MTDIDNLITAYNERADKRPICEQTAYEAIRHINRNCDMQCESHEDGSECVEWGRYDGTLLAQIWNAFPALVSELEAARKVVAASDTIHKMILFVGLKDDGANGNVANGIDEGHVMCGRAIRDYEQASAEYLRVMEEQR